MRISMWICGLVAAVAMAGCGGGGGSNGPRNAEVAGIVTDFNGDVVRNAKVWINQFGETTTNSSGAYLLTGVSEGDWKVRAEITKDGVTYHGENVARVFSGERTKSANVTVVRDNQTATVFGRVIDNQGFTVQGARVFAIAPSDGGVYYSTYEITDSDGKFTLDKLVGGVDFKVVATGRGFNSDQDTVNINAGDSLELVLTLKNATDPLLPAPTGLGAVAWTSPFESTRSPQSRAAIENIKRIFDPRTPAHTATRTTINGNWIETDLFWDPYPDSAAHIGFGIYRRPGNSGTFTAIDFLRDTEAEVYEDADDDLLEGQTWSYIITGVNTNYPDTNNSEGASSNTAVAQTLGDLFLNPVTQGPLTFHWQGGSGATEYLVYLFDEYPGVGVDYIWNNSGVSTANLQLAYNGSALQSGHKYYYIVLGLANSQNSRTITEVGDFIAN